MEAHPQLLGILESFSPISLGEMSAIRLMNRTDTKFLTTVRVLAELLQQVHGSYHIQEIQGRRISCYATTYWDDPDTHEMYRMHHCGHRPRTKVRVRSYVDSDQNFLEIKKKDNHGKTSKQRIVVPSLEAVVCNHWGEEFLNENSGYSFEKIVPTLSNRFHRITLVNKRKTERLTIDFDLEFRNLENQVERDMGSLVIIELKRDGLYPSPILPILRTMHIKPAGFSKYCIGSAVTNSALRQNLFKERLVYIRKLVEQG